MRVLHRQSLSLTTVRKIGEVCLCGHPTAKCLMQCVSIESSCIVKRTSHINSPSGKCFLLWGEVRLYTDLVRCSLLHHLRYFQLKLNTVSVITNPVTRDRLP